jgi:hypothetical protein
MPKLLSAVPKLAALDIAKAIEFYEAKLGFKKLFDEGNYGGVKRDSVEVHFWKAPDKTAAELTACRICVDGVADLNREYEASGVIHPNGKLERKPWGTLEFSILDLDGNCIGFVEASA